MTDFATTRHALHRVAAHVLGRRRYEVTGRFGLRAAPGGFATPAFGDGPELLRIAGAMLVRETTAGAEYAPVDGSTVRLLAAFAGADLGREFSVGTATPELGDVDAPIAVDASSCAAIAEWFAFAWRAIDAVVGALPPAAQPAVLQLWPEHFDAGTHVAVAGGRRCNLGASPGDGYCDDPYIYVGPWDDDRPGDAAFWNAPFGAVLPRAEVGRSGDPVAAVTGFLVEGLGRLGGVPA